MRYSKFEMVMRPARVYESKYDYEITRPLDVFRFAKLLDLDAMPEEHLIAITVGTGGGINGFCEVSKGTLDSSLATPREMFRAAIMQNAAGIILVHNHPSGSPTPSNSDIETTKRMVEAGKLLGINVLDHVIVGAFGFNSLKESGHMS